MSLAAGFSRRVGLHCPSNQYNGMMYFVNGLYPIMVI